MRRAEKPVRLTSSNAREFQPAQWSPDGQWIAYVTWSDDGGDVWKNARRPGPARLQKLTRIPAFYRDPDSGRRIRSESSRCARPARLSPEWELWFRAIGHRHGCDLGFGPQVATPRLVVPARGTGRPHFTTDPERTRVYSNQGLQSYRWDGTDRRTILKVEGKSRTPQPTPASEVRISPDGKHALAKLNEQLFLIAMPAAGGDTPTVNVNTPSVPVKKLTDIGADDFQWADGGKAMTWALGSSFFRRVAGRPSPTIRRKRKTPTRRRKTRLRRRRNLRLKKSRSASSSRAASRRSRGAARRQDHHHEGR